MLLDMCTDGDISRETFKKKTELNNQNIHELEEKIKLIRKQIKENDTQEDLNKRIECLSAFLKMKCFSKKEKIPESIIDIECFLVFLGNGAFGFTRLAAFKSGR